MKKKQYREKIYDLLNDIDEINDRIDKYLTQVLTIPQAKKRDYIVRTKYYGKIKDDNIKKDFKQSIEDQLQDTFSGICNNLLNYEFYYVDDGISPCRDILDTFYKTLEQYEYKQFVVDTYK